MNTYLVHFEIKKFGLFATHKAESSMAFDAESSKDAHHLCMMAFKVACTSDSIIHIKSIEKLED